jgi:hypothetical protein
MVMNDLLDAPDRLHNQPPLSEQLAVETEGFAEDTAKLRAAFASSAITDDKSAADVLTLAAQMRALAKLVEEAQKERERPLRRDLATVQEAFTGILRPLRQTEGECRKMQRVWEDKRQAEAAHAKAIAEAEAEAARKAAEAAQELASASMSAKLRLAAIKAREEADAAADELARVAAPLPPIQSDLATLGYAREPAFEVTDHTKALTWVRKEFGAALKKFVEDCVGKALRNAGVDKIADPQWKGIPGVRAWVGKRMVQR